VLTGRQKKKTIVAIFIKKKKKEAASGSERKTAEACRGSEVWEICTVQEPQVNVAKWDVTMQHHAASI